MNPRDWDVGAAGGWLDLVEDISLNEYLDTPSCKDQQRRESVRRKSSRGYVKEDAAEARRRVIKSRPTDRVWINGVMSCPYKDPFFKGITIC